MIGSRLSVYEGKLKDLVFLFLSISLVTFSNSLFLFIEKLLLARLSASAMEAAVNAAYVSQIFQAPCVALALMAQVFVGRHLGANNPKAIGPLIWQYLWFSLFSLLLFPINILYGKYYFIGTSLEEAVFPYFYYLSAINFLYPFGVALSCFYLGQGKTRLILYATLGSQTIKLFLAYLFIFGLDPWIPEFGILGGIISTAIAQTLFCLMLFYGFLHSRNLNLFNSRDWSFKPKLFWESIHPGLLRACNRILNFTCWAAIARLMTAKGGDYVLVLSIGGTLFIFLPFIGDAICQTQTTVVSQLLGAGKKELIKKAFHSGSILALITACLLSIPLVIFPCETYNYLFPKVPIAEKMIRHILGGIWLSFTFYSWGFVPISYILAFQDMKFSLFMGIFGWINGFMLMFLFVNYVQIEAYYFWTILSLMHGSTLLLYYWRMKYLLTTKLQDPLLIQVS